MSRTLPDQGPHEPWVYWWLLITDAKRRELAVRYISTTFSEITPERRKKLWVLEGSPELLDMDWLRLAELILDQAQPFTPPQKRAIWREIYRIASTNYNPCKNDPEPTSAIK